MYEKTRLSTYNQSFAKGDKMSRSGNPNMIEDAYIEIPGDPSVGIPSQGITVSDLGFQPNIYEDPKGAIEDMRKLLQEVGQLASGEYAKVVFDFELPEEPDDYEDFESDAFWQDYEYEHETPSKLTQEERTRLKELWDLWGMRELTDEEKYETNQLESKIKRIG